MNPLAYLKLAGAGIIVLALIGFGLYIWNLKSDATAAQAKAAEALGLQLSTQATNNELAAQATADAQTIADQKKALTDQAKALAEAAANQQQNDEAANSIKDDISNVKPISQAAACPAPSIDVALGRLRGLTSAPSSPSDRVAPTARKDPPPAKPIARRAPTGTAGS